MWGMQVELGNSAGPFIPTTSAAVTAMDIPIDIPVTLDANQPYEMMVVHSNLPQGNGSGGSGITSVVGQIVNLPGYTGNTVKRIVCNAGAIDREVVAYGVGFVQLDDVTGIAAGQDWTVYDTDVLETRTVVTLPGTTSVLTVVPPFSAQPAEFQMWLFGQVGNNAQLFRVTEKSRDADLRCKIKAIQYDGTVYADLEPVTQSSKANSPYIGPVFPVTGTNDATSGTRAWATPGNVIAPEGVVAQATNSAAGVTETSQYLVMTGFNPRMQPTDAANGIRIEVDRWSVVDGTGTGFVQDVSLQLMLNGSPIGTAKSIAGHWSALTGWSSYGGDGDMWGTSNLQPADINDPTFGARLQVTMNTPVGKTITQANVDSSRMTVFIAKAPKAAVTNLLVSEVFQRDAIHATYYPVVQCTWTKGPKTYGAKVYVSQKVPGAASFAPPVLAQQVVGATSFSFVGVDGAQYLVQVVGFDANGNDAPWYNAPQATITVIGAAQLPADVSNFRITSWVDPNLTLAWTANTEPTLSGYEIRFKASTNAAISEWDSATPIAFPTNVATSQAVTQGNGTYFIKAKLLAGYYSLSPKIIHVNSNSSHNNGQGSGLPATGTSGPFSWFSSDAAGISSVPTGVVTWIPITVYRPDGTTFVVPSSTTLYPWQPFPPAMSQVAGGAKAGATVWARAAYCRGGAVVGFGEANSFVLSANNLLKVTSPSVRAPLSGGVPSATWSVDTFGGALNATLESRAPDVGRGWIKLNAGTSAKLNGSGKLLVGAASSQVQYFIADHPWYDGYSAQMDVDLSSTSAATDVLGILFSVRDSNNLYKLQCRGDGGIELVKVVSGVATSLGVLAGSFKTGTLKVVVTMTSATSTQVLAYWNGVFQTGFNDTALPAIGAFGVRIGLEMKSAATGVTIANWSITDALVDPPLAGIDGWIPLVGATAAGTIAQVTPRTPIAIGTDWTEPAGGSRWPSNAGSPASFSATAITGQYATWGGGKAFFNASLAAALAYNTATSLYPTTDNLGSEPLFGGNGVNQPGTLDMIAGLFLDGRYALTGGAGMTFTTQTAAGGGAGSGGGGGGCSRKDMLLCPLGQHAFGSEFPNQDWIEVECENGCSKVATPSDRVMTYEYGVLELQDERMVQDDVHLITELGKSKLKRKRRFTEAGVAVNLEMNEGHLYWAGKEKGKGILSSNLKPL
jgi:hypothetical protein